MKRGPIMYANAIHEGLQTLAVGMSYTTNLGITYI